MINQRSSNSIALGWTFCDCVGVRLFLRDKKVKIGGRFSENGWWGVMVGYGRRERNGDRRKTESKLTEVP